MKRSLKSLCFGFLLVLLFLAHTISFAQTKPPDDIPKIILSGLEAYKSSGPEAAVKAWIKGSPIEGSKEALSQANVLRQIQDFYGEYKTYEVIQSKNVASTTRILYMSINFEKGPLFAKFVTYKGEEGWIITGFTFNTKEELVLPSCP